ncbi:hypothetical protein ACFS2C_28170 [Prauserella oleivorans]|uniref:Uncharacterized protein n=1 Tax=Prauserella oleivorans TaxID=1478153 RepID=A0ABW5WL91_9PSEU
MTTPPTPRPTRVSRADAGEQVLQELINAAPAGLRKAHLVDQTGLTPSQVYGGTVWIKDTGASRENRPFTVTRRDGYRFSDDPADWTAYERGQLRRMLTTLHRLMTGTLDPHLQREPADPLARMLHSQINGMIGALEYALTEADRLTTQ